MAVKTKKDAMICFAIDSETKESIESYIYESGRWDSVSEFMRWLLKAFFRKALAQ